MKIETKYNIGDTVYRAGVTTVQKSLECPDCNNTRVWRVETPTGSKFDVPCQRCCSSGYRNELAYSIYEPVVETCKIAQVRYETPEPVRYLIGPPGATSGWIVSEDSLFETWEEAERYANHLAARENEADNPVNRNRTEKMAPGSYFRMNIIAREVKKAKEEAATFRRICDHVWEELIEYESEESEDNPAIQKIKDVLTTMATHERYSLED